MDFVSGVTPCSISGAPAPPGQFNSLSASIGLDGGIDRELLENTIHNMFLMKCRDAAAVITVQKISATQLHRHFIIIFWKISTLEWFLSQY